jgi:hypothetical protein
MRGPASVCLAPVAITFTVSSTNERPPYSPASGPRGLIDRPKSLFHSHTGTSRQQSHAAAPLHAVIRALAQPDLTLVIVPSALAPRRQGVWATLGRLLATGYSHAVCSASDRCPCCFPAAGFAPSFLPNIFFYHGSPSPSRLSCASSSFPQPRLPRD